MTGDDMPAPNEMVWYKWFPVKAMTSLRFASLSCTEEGVYRRMMDLASIAQPSSRRGWFYEHDVPASMEEVWRMLRIIPKTGEKCLKKFTRLGLMIQDENGAWGFANFAKHQRSSKLRVRKDGLGSAEVGAKLAQNRRKIGATEAYNKEAYNKEADNQQPARCAESLILQMGLQGISREQAIDLAERYGAETVERQLKWLPVRNPKHPAAMLVKAIKENWNEPVQDVKPEKTREDIEYWEKWGPVVDRAAQGVQTMRDRGEL